MSLKIIINVTYLQSHFSFMVLLEALLSDRLGECGPRSTVFVFSSRLKERVLTFAANVEA